MSGDDNEAFLKASAEDLIGRQFTEVIRGLIRAISAASDPETAIGPVVMQMRFFSETIKGANESVTVAALFSRAVSDIRGSGRRDEIVGAALKGMKLVAEQSCTDAAARARTSKAEQDFLAAIDRVSRSHE